MRPRYGAVVTEPAVSVAPAVCRAEPYRGAVCADAVTDAAEVVARGIGGAVAAEGRLYIGAP